MWSSRRRSIVAGLGTLALVVAAGVAQRDVSAAADLAPLSPAALQVLITTSELAVGENRFAFGLLKDGKLLADATVAVRTYDIRGEPARLTAHTPALYHALEVVEQGNHVHVHPDGTRHVHRGTTDVQGIYVAALTFESPGAWGLEVLAKQPNGSVETARLSVNALEASRAPRPGTPAPRSRNLVAADVRDLSQIDSSEPPDPRLHQTRIADAIAQGKPQVIVFASPRLCTSRVCGPVVDVVRTLIPTYGDRVAFIHQEVWQRGASQEFAPTMVEWNLRSEPWIFVVDGQGMIRASFEGLTTRREVEAALRSVLGLR